MTTLLSVRSVDSPLHRASVPRRRQVTHLGRHGPRHLKADTSPLASHGKWYGPCPIRAAASEASNNERSIPLRHWWAGLSTPDQAGVKSYTFELDRPSFPPGRDGLPHGPSLTFPMSGIGSVARENNRIARTLNHSLDLKKEVAVDKAIITTIEFLPKAEVESVFGKLKESQNQDLLST